MTHGDGSEVYRSMEARDIPRQTIANFAATITNLLGFNTKYTQSEQFFYLPIFSILSILT